MYNLIVGLAVWVGTLLTLYIGYLFGKYSYDKPTPFKFPSLRLKPRQPLGAVSKISQMELEKRGTRLEATEKAMEETLKEIL
jgi:hypothetical protein